MKLKCVCVYVCENSCVHLLDLNEYLDRMKHRNSGPIEICDQLSPYAIRKLILREFPEAAFYGLLYIYRNLVTEFSINTRSFCRPT